MNPLAKICNPEPVRLSITPRKACPTVFMDLERKGLLRSMLHWEHGSSADPENYRVDALYACDCTQGGHALVRVAYNMETVRLGYHRDNEDFILVKDISREQKPLFLVVSYCTPSEMEKKIHERSLGVDDFIIIELVYNDPVCSMFTVFGNVVHCELTYEGQHAPEFFVTEPASMGTVAVDLKEYVVEIALQKKNSGEVIR